MKAITIHEFGGPEVLHLEEIDKPVPRDNEVLIEVHASSLNPVDAKSITKDSKYSSSIHLPTTPGLDVAGVVERVGESVKTLHPGDLVYGQASTLRKGSGAFAEYAVTTEDSLAFMPRSLSFVQAASVPLAACSAYEAMVDHIKLRAGQRILIQGGSGGIGSFAIQLAKYLKAYVTTTATGEGVEFCHNLGADLVIDYKQEPFEELGPIYDAVLDTVGGDIYDKSFQVLKPGGVIVSMLAIPNEILMRRHAVTAVLEMTAIYRKVLTEIAELIDHGILKVHIAQIYPLHRTKDAYQAKEQNKVLGKIAITINHKK
jgi:NADPH:quinone reductase-like Zn-dependent oxidoreductase